MAVSVVIPALNEEDRIGAAIDSAHAAGAAEVIVVDGGSTDGTAQIARARRAHVLVDTTLRARQLNRGAAAAVHDAVIFLHADSHLPPGAARAVEASLVRGFCFGGFRLAFIEPALRLRWVALMVNARTSLTRAPWGDQAQFARRETFLALGGYPELPIMEDYELARRMKRAGRTVLLPLAVQTSGRRFLQKGVLRSSALNWLIIAAYHLGVAPERLARWYRT